MTEIRHRPRVTRRREETREGEAWAYQVRCPCNTEFETHYAKRIAQNDRSRHLMDVAPPREERCRDPKRHGCQPHDRCVVCSHQLALFDIEEAS
jgi:hypothetical protein